MKEPITLDTIFLFDLDSTITSKEILPYIASIKGIQKELEKMTEETMKGHLPFRESFLARVDLLKDIPLEEAADVIASVPLNEKLVAFIREHKDICYIITGNLDVWIGKLVERIGLEPDHCFCSNAEVTDGQVTGVEKILDKVAVTTNFERYRVAIGDGNNDIGMIRTAEVGIAFGGVRELSERMKEEADIVCLTEDELVETLNGFLI